ncbi:MAG: hypothetical protein IJ657_05990 [Acidaminococcaceae bacterium]|nr:hypothetical protein [Acidaminococcaceae bacterium]
MTQDSLLVWGKLLIAWTLTYYVYKDAFKRDLPYKNAWVVAVFIFWPLFIGYLYFRHHIENKGKIPSLYKREAEMRVQMEEQRIKIDAERRAWKKQKELEMEQNRLTEAELEEARRKRAEDKARRMSELAEERRLQEEAAAKLLHIK